MMGEMVYQFFKCSLLRKRVNTPGPNLISLKVQLNRPLLVISPTVSQNLYILMTIPMGSSRPSANYKCQQGCELSEGQGHYQCGPNLVSTSGEIEYSSLSIQYLSIQQRDKLDPWPMVANADQRTRYILKYVGIPVLRNQV